MTTKNTKTTAAKTTATVEVKTNLVPTVRAIAKQATSVMKAEGKKLSLPKADQTRFDKKTKAIEAASVSVIAAVSKLESALKDGKAELSAAHKATIARLKAEVKTTKAGTTAAATKAPKAAKAEKAPAATKAKTTKAKTADAAAPEAAKPKRARKTEGTEAKK